MNSNRRNFIKMSTLLSFGISFIPFRIYGKEAVSGSFLSRIGLCTGIANSGILVSAGYSYLEESVRSFLVPSESEEVFNEKLALLKSSGIPVEACNSFLPGELKCVGPEIHHEKILQFAEIAFRRAEQAGIRTIAFGSGGSRTIPENFPREEAKQQFIALCRQMAPVAKKYKVVISLEPLNKSECNFINSVAEGGEIVKSVNHSNFRLLADFYHMFMEEEGPESFTEYGKYVSHIHLAEKEGRSAPGVHGEDFTAFFKALKKAGYTGRISVECNWDNLENQAQKALHSLQGQIALLDDE
jgi:sugar phosphate isomerase/epimerase